MSCYRIGRAQICRKQTIAEVCRADMELAPAEPLSAPGLYARCLTLLPLLTGFWSDVMLNQGHNPFIQEKFTQSARHSLCARHFWGKKKIQDTLGSLTSLWRYLRLKKKRRMDRFGQFITSNHSAFPLWDPFLHVWKWLLHWFSSCHMIRYKPAQCKLFKANSPLLIQKERPFISIT